MLVSTRAFVKSREASKDTGEGNERAWWGERTKEWSHAWSERADVSETAELATVKQRGEQRVGESLLCDEAQCKDRVFSFFLRGYVLCGCKSIDV